MKLIVEQTISLQGEITIPGSKSHTIRAVIIASLAEGKSTIRNPLSSDDTLAAVHACRALGAQINTDSPHEWTVEGFGKNPKKPEGPINLQNSGTSLRLMSGVIAALCDFEVELDGDESLRTRPMQPLLTSLNQLGAEAFTLKNNGLCPLHIKGKMKGGKTSVSGVTSQFASSLLIACPLLPEDTEIYVFKPNEVPYIDLTLAWLKEQGIKVEGKSDHSYFKVFGNQKYKPFTKPIPADWSSAAFPMVAGAITQSNILIKNLDINDVQGDKAIVDYIQRMGGSISIEKLGLRIIGKPLHGAELDINKTPDALPALAVLGCFAQGTTTLYNVPQARIKETDRIAAMAEELAKLGADIKERDEGLVIHQSKLVGNKARGHGDHRIVMALSLAGMNAQGKTEITNAEAISVTFPGYIELMKSLGAKFELA
ncbi:3-phosphoshikimate 1-carboxyvinyltransferase [Candidatus Woesearchaeota archaeon]|nr:3-phosphoshikimate 1-carboxyvinyltransferase [Candidatus Woesearchaeota archaeon]